MLSWTPWLVKISGEGARPATSAVKSISMRQFSIVTPLQTGRLGSRDAQPFGLPSPKIKSVTGDWTFAGTGLLPNSSLSATATWISSAGGDPESVNVYNSRGLVSQNDGSFSVMVEPTDTSIEYKPGSLALTVTDSDKNWASGVVSTDTTGNQLNLTTKSGLAT